MKLVTKYLGMDLKNPVIPSADPSQFKRANYMSVLNSYK